MTLQEPYIKTSLKPRQCLSQDHPISKATGKLIATVKGNLIIKKEKKIFFILSFTGSKIFLLEEKQIFTFLE